MCQVSDRMYRINRFWSGQANFFILYILLILSKRKPVAKVSWPTCETPPGPGRNTGLFKTPYLRAKSGFAT